MSDFALIVQQVKEGKNSIAAEAPGMLAFVSQQEEPAVLRECKAQATAVATYLAQRKDGSVEEYNAAVKVRERVEHRLGEVLAETVNHNGSRGVGDTVSPTLPDCLADTEANRKKISSRAQQLATLPWEEIEKRIDEATERNERVKVSRIVKALKREKAVAQIAAESPPLPCGPHRVMTADPPWIYDNRAEDGSHRAANPYPSLTLERIKSYLKDNEYQLGDDVVLWLWTTNAHLRVAFEVVEAWGFTYKTLLTWVKDRMGTGDWLRGQTEHCLMAIRGKPAIDLTNQTTVLHGPLRQHSRKPEEFYALVESLCPGSKVELFARHKRKGWVQHGNEI
jgi:N6-adenosine-specific RNA methylase IME4